MHIWVHIYIHYLYKYADMYLCVIYMCKYIIMYIHVFIYFVCTHTVYKYIIYSIYVYILHMFSNSKCSQSGKAMEKTANKSCDVEVYEKKIRLLEKQRKDVSLVQIYGSSSFAIRESLCVCVQFPICWLVICFTSWFGLQVLEVNKQWDIQWNAMKSQFEQKVQ